VKRPTETSTVPLSRGIDRGRASCEWREDLSRSGPSGRSDVCVLLRPGRAFIEGRRRSPDRSDHGRDRHAGQIDPHGHRGRNALRAVPRQSGDRHERLFGAVHRRNWSTPPASNFRTPIAVRNFITAPCSQALPTNPLSIGRNARISLLCSRDSEPYTSRTVVLCAGKFQ